MFKKDLHILLVEDNDDHAHIVQRLLSAMDGAVARVDRQASLTSAMSLLKERQYDVVLLDLTLPDSELVETLDQFLDAATDEPVICLTSVDDLDFATGAVQQGAQDYLVKSNLTRDLLLRSIRYAIERHKVSLELERSNDELRQFAGTVAHEVRSPLSVLVTGCEVIRMHIEDDRSQDVGGVLETMETAARGMTELVRELLDFAQIESHARTFENVDMESVYHYVVALYREEAEQVGAQITHDPLPVICGNVSHIRHLMQNLLANALKYRRPGITPQIHFSVQQCDGLWQFCVADNGIGIPAAEQDKIFEVFKRAHRGDYPGTGIGLAFCKRIVDHHGGRIWVESTEGEGSRFCFTLPLRCSD